MCQPVAVAGQLPLLGLKAVDDPADGLVALLPVYFHGIRPSTQSST